MAFAERVKVVIDVAADGAKNVFADLKRNVAEAEGGFGKIKAAGASAWDGVKQNAGPVMATAGLAIAGFALKAVGDFRDTALEAKALGDAMGTSTENASRLNAIMKPLGIEVGDAQDVFNNLASMISEGDQALTDLGVTVAKDAQGRTDMYETFIRIVEAVGGIEDPAKRAAAASKLFGEEGARQFLPLVEQSDQLRKNLKGVSEQKIIDKDELRKAEQMRDAQRAIDEAVQNVTLALGGMVAEMAPAIERGAELVEILMKIDQMTGVLEAAANPIPDDGGKLGDYIRDLAMLGETEEELIRILHERGESERNIALIVQTRRDMDREAAAATVESMRANERGKEKVDALARAEDARAYAHQRAAEQAQESANRTAALEDTVRRLLGVLDIDDATANLQQSFRDLETAAVEAYDSAINKSEDAAEKQAAYDQKMRDTKRSVIEFAAEVLHMPAERITEISAQIDSGQLAQVEADLTWLARKRSAFINVSTTYDPSGTTVHQRATGGYTGPGETTMVHPGEALRFPDGTFVYTRDDTNRLFGQPSGGDTYNITNIDSSLTPRQVRQLQRKANRRGYR